VGLGSVFNRKFVLYSYICLSHSFWAFGSDCYLFAIGFCNNFLASQHTKSKKSSSERVFQLLLVHFFRSQLSTFSKAQQLDCLFQLLAGRSLQKAETNRPIVAAA